MTDPPETVPFVTVERRPDGVALLLLDRPKANALSSTEDAARGMASFAAQGPGKATFVGR